MKIHTVISAIILSCCLSCQQARLPSFQEEQMKMIEEFREQFSGTWQIKHAQIQHSELVDINYSTGIITDTLLHNLATLHIQPATQQSDDRLLTLEGTLLFRNQTIPLHIQFYPHTSNESLSQGVVSINLGLSKTNSPLPQAEMSYLTTIGFLGENFSIKTIPKQSTMTWQGLNRAITEAKLIKI